MHHFKNSSMLSHCEHEGDCLTITFAKGQKYKYHGVPTDEYHGLINADKASQHFLNNIKGRYKHEKINE